MSEEHGPEAPLPGPPDEELLEQVERLKRRGEHAAAATALLDAGHPLQAGALFEHIFEDEQALLAYEAAEELVGAMRVALRRSDAAAIERIVERATKTGKADALIDMLQRELRHGEVARIHQARGDLELAATSYREAQRFYEAALCLEDMGDLRGAGVLFERHLDADPSHPGACLHLGRILARFSRHDDAITLLQRALRGADDKDAILLLAAPTLVLSFVSLGYDVAAEAVFERWLAAAERRGEASPGSLEEFLQSDSAAAFAAVVSRGGEKKAAQAASSSSGLDLFFGSDEDSQLEAPEDSDEERDAKAAGMLLAGRYLLGEPLGGGGVGQVFRAYDAFSDRPVAVKIFGSQAMQSEAVKAYAREARAAAALEHPAVVRLVELNLPQGYIVTELVDAESVEHRLREGGSAEWLGPFARALLDLLADCHRVGLVHGGLKPTNVFLLAGAVRVADFGAHHLLALRSTETGGLASVWPYLAPEQLFGAPPGASADLYAVAAMLYRALTGQAPFPRPEDDRRAPPAPPSSLREDLAGAWDELLLRALSPRPSERFSTARELLFALPPMPARSSLPQAVSLAGEAPAAVVLEALDRYAKGALVYRHEDTRVYEGTDLTVGRPVWLVQTDDREVLRALAICARITKGMQPVYDVLPEAGRAVVARDARRRQAELSVLRAVPQSLARDLAAVAQGLEALHDSELCLGGFAVERAMGPVGPRLRLAPAPPPQRLSAEGAARDWDSFASLVDESFEVGAAHASDTRRRLLVALEQRRVLGREDVSALAERDEGEGWAAFLEALSERLVSGASGRVMARLAASVLRG
jgi:eukaryotic-like serine/threonine-protein kinase